MFVLFSILLGQQIAAKTGDLGSLTWTQNGETLTISGNGPMPDLDEEEVPWNYYNVSYLVIEEGVTHIGTCISELSTRISSLEIPKSVKSVSDNCLYSYVTPEPVLRDFYIKSATFSSVSIESMKYYYSKNKDVTYHIPFGSMELFKQQWGDEFNYEEDMPGSGSTGDLTWTMDKYGTLLIIGDGKMPDYSSPTATPWATFADKIKNVIFTDTIKHIGDYALAGCTNLERLVIKSHTPPTLGVESMSKNQDYTINVNHKYKESYATNWGSQYHFEGSIIWPSSDLTKLRTWGFGTNLVHTVYVISPDTTEAIVFPSLSETDQLNYCAGWIVNNGEPNFVRELAQKIKKLTLYDGFTSFTSSRGTDYFTEIHLPNTIKDYDFEDCTKLKRFEFPTSMSSIPSMAFYRCYALDSLHIPAHVKTIGTEAFLNCKSLKTITIEEGLTAILAEPFKGCPISEIRFPSTLGSIGDKSLSNFSEVYFNSVPSGWGAFCNNEGKIIIHVPCGKAKTAAARWSHNHGNTKVTFANIIDDVFTYKVKVTTNDSTLGHVAYTDTLSCTYNKMRIEAIPQEGCHFRHFSNGSQNIIDSIDITSDTVIVAYFERDNAKELTIDTEITGHGSVQITHLGNDIQKGDLITVKAVPDSSCSFFYMWSDGNQKATRSFVINADTTIKAIFLEGISGTPDYRTGCDSVLYAISPEKVSRYVKWDGQKVVITDSVSKVLDFAYYMLTRYIFEIPANIKTIKNEINGYTFYLKGKVEKIEGSKHTLYVPCGLYDYYVELSNGKNTVISYYDGFNFIATSNNEAYGEVIFADSNKCVIPVTAKAKPGYHFAYWSNGETTDTLTIELYSDTTLVAYFAPDAVTLTIEQLEGGTIIGEEGTYPYESVVELIAKPDSLYEFERWSDGETDSIRQITLTADTTISAIFRKEETTTVKTIESDKELVDVYNIQGVCLKQRVKREDALHDLPASVYVVGRNLKVQTKH